MSDVRSSGHPGGRLWLAPGLSASEAEAARAFVAAGPHLDMAALRGARRPHDDRALAEPDVPGIGVCVLKAFGAGSSARPLRRLRKALQLRFAPPARRTLRTAAALRAAAVPSFDAVAAWTERRGPFRNFLLYRRLDGEVLGDRWMGAMPFPVRGAPLPPERLPGLMERAGALARDLAEAGFVHVDLHPGNLIVPAAAAGAGAVALLDLDAVRRAPGRAWGRRVRFTSMLKSLRHVAECFPDEADEAFGAFVRAYCRGDAAAERAVRRALALWRGRSGRSRLLSTVASFFACPPPPRPDGPPHPWDAPPRALPRYDLAFSLGYDCNCSLALRRAGLQFRSYPFDWLKKAPPVPRAELLARRFAGWLAPENLENLGAPPFARRAGRRHLVVLDRASGLEHRHDFPLGRPVAESLPEVAAKYARRTERLLREIGAAERVAAVFCVGFRFPSLPMEDLVAAREALRGAFGDKIDVIGIADDAPGGPAGRPVRVERAAGGHVERVSAPCLAETPQGLDANVRALSAVLRGLFVVPDPRTAAEKRAWRAASRRAAREKYAAKTWAGMQWNRFLFRLHRSLAKTLQRKGILPPNETAT